MFEIGHVIMFIAMDFNCASWHAMFLVIHSKWLLKLQCCC